MFIHMNMIKIQEESTSTASSTARLVGLTREEAKKTTRMSTSTPTTRTRSKVSCSLVSHDDSLHFSFLTSSPLQSHLTTNTRFSLVFTTLVVTIVLVMFFEGVECLGPLVKVCGARELKEVTESICSTLGKRDLSLPLASLYWMRNNRDHERVKSRCF